MHPEFSGAEHTAFRTMIDEALVDRSAPQPVALQRHLEVCEACRHYLESSVTVIAALGNYAFPVDPSRNAGIFEALRLRENELRARPSFSLNSKRFAWVCSLAVLFTAAGLLIDVRCSSLLAAHLSSNGLQALSKMTALWFATSFGSLLLLLLLPFLLRPMPSRSTLSPP